jgi:quinol monooxygenase YgiN
MGKVIFSIKYDIIPEKRTEYLDFVRELKNLVHSDGLESYSVYESKNKINNFEEIYIYQNKEAWENSDSQIDERVDILMTKLSDLIQEKSTNYSTLFEVDN